MADIVNNFLLSVFPVALMFFLGFVLGRRGTFESGDASAIFKFIAQLAAPAIIFNIMFTSNFAGADLTLVGLYLLAELVVYLATMILAIMLFRLDLKNAVLAGMAASFSNHVLFAYPVTQLAFAPPHVLPVEGIIAFDMVIFTLSVVVLDVNAGPRDGLFAALRRQTRNPLLVALLAGLLVRMIPGEPNLTLVRSAEFIAAAAAPCGLFATGVVLSAPIAAVNMRLAVMISAMKMVAHPLIGAVFVLMLGGYAFDPARTTMLVMASPVGVMALTFANRYDGESGAIAMAILWSMVISVLIVPMLIAI